jgi:hypothetical protein
MYFNVNFNVLKQNYCALVGVIKDWIANKGDSLEINNKKATHIFTSLGKNAEKSQHKLLNKSFVNMAKVGCCTGARTNHNCVPYIKNCRLKSG